ncbi:MAG: hypothetical protein IPN55_09555 [Saprospiraceae bacterium]|nr:hypothetical protein [Candidatus Brachybacter algidus]
MTKVSFELYSKAMWLKTSLDEIRKTLRTIDKPSDVFKRLKQNLTFCNNAAKNAYPEKPLTTAHQHAFEHLAHSSKKPLNNQLLKFVNILH